MIAAWMLCVVVLGALLLGVALALDAICVRLGRPRRWVWAGAMVAMCVVPFVPRPSVPLLRFATVLGGTPATTRHPDATPAAAPVTTARLDTATRLPSTSRDAVPVTPGTTMVVEPARRAVPRLTITGEGGSRSGNLLVITRESPLARFDAPLLAAWATLALAGLALVLAATIRLRRDARRWTRADDALQADAAREAGRPVTVWRSTELGPAAFGLRTLQIVVPRWIDELPERERALLLAHEASHVRAHDPRLLAGALALVTLVPWHLPLLVAYRRLCRAVEHDCDARVLARHGDARGYGRLLVHTAEWLLTRRGAWRGSVAARWILAPVPAFAAPVSELESRLRALVRPAMGWRSRVATVAAGACALVALVVACAVPSPTRGSVIVSMRTGPVVDSLVSFRALMRDPRISRHAARRFQALQDSLALDVARREVPGFEQLAAGMDTAYVWMVLDAGLRRRHHIMTESRHAYRWSADTNGGFPPLANAATAATPGTSLRTNAHSFARAFPTLDAQRVDGTGSVVTMTATGPVRLEWAQLYPGDTTLREVLRAKGDSLFVPTWFRTIALGVTGDAGEPAGFRSALDTGLRENIRTFRPDLLDRDGIDDQFVWFVLGPDGTAIAHATGREGLGVRDTGSPTRPPLARATATTPAERLTIDGEAWRAKFPTLAFPTHGFGWTTLRVGAREVNVLWVLTDLSLATGRSMAERRARQDSLARAAERAARSTRVALLSDQFPATLPDSLRAARFRDIRLGFDRSSGADPRFAELLRGAIAEVRPALLRGRRTDADFVWLVFDSTARIVAADTGRAGLGVHVEGRGELLPKPRATDTTARDALVLDDRAFRAKFGDRIARVNARTWQGLSLPNGYVNVIWTVAARD
jgi:beta-lactamase regulating signal transducer with metallopeptidase domain